MADNGPKSKAPRGAASHWIDPKRAKKEEDSFNRLEALAAYVRETQTDVLDLEKQGLGIEEVQFILNSTADLKFTELNLKLNYLTNGILLLAPLLSRLKIKKLDVTDCRLTKEDVLQLVEVLRHSEITDLKVCSYPWDNEDVKCEKFDSDDALKCIAHLQKSKLVTLNLDYFNYFPPDGITSLLPEFLKCPITSLNFGRHHRNSIDFIFVLSNLSHSSVTDLNLTDTKLSSEALRELCRRLPETNVEKLNLDRNGLKDDELNILADGLVGSKVTDLSLIRNKFSNFDPLFTKLKETHVRSLNIGCSWNLRRENLFHPNSFTGSSLTSLEVYSCRLNDTAGVELMESLRFSNVRKLKIACNDMASLSSNDIISLTINKFAENAKDINLIDLDISANPITANALFTLGKCLKDTKLTCLRLGDFDCVRPLKAVDLLSFLKLTEGSSIRRIEMRHFRSSWDSPPVCESEMLANTTFTEWDLCGSAIGENALIVIPLLKFSAITYLNLRNNSITDNGAAVIAECLKETQIRRLDLSSNSITSQGAKALALSLKDSNLLHLRLQKNQIKDDGFESLAEHAKNTFISELDVSYGVRERVLFFDKVLWQNRIAVQKIVSAFNQIAPKPNSDEFCFDQSLDDGDISAFLDKCMQFYKTMIDNPRGINVVFELLEEKSVSYSRDKIFTLVFEDFPKQFSHFIACKIEADMFQHVSILEKAEEMGLAAVVESLLLHRPIYTLDKEQGILNPHVYRLLVKYKQPVCNSDVEPLGVSKIINYFTEHADVEGAGDLIKLLQDGKV